MASQQISRRVIAARQNARLGGLKTASTHSAEFLEERATKAGEATRDTYGNGYYSHIATCKERKSIKSVQKEITNSVETQTTAQLIDAAVKTLVPIQM